MGNRRPVAAIRKDGSVIPVEITIAVMKTGERNLFIAVVRDITERQKHEQRLRDMATRDPLTQMPNRTLFNERLDEELDSARSTGTRFAVIFVDLDHFKYINDAMGHVIGDRVIQQAGARLRNCVGPGDLMAHLGGDEFSAILSDIREDADVAAVASRMLATLAEPFQMEDREIFTSGSLGVVLYPEHAGTVSELIKNVDTACHKAKQEGRNNCQFYTQKLSADVKRRMEIESGLRRALENDEFSLYYQPKVDLRSHRLVGAEALLRWETDHMGFVSPAEFVPVAEDMGLIVPIGEWVLRNACADAAEWISDTDHPIHVGVNLSARQFLQGDLTEKVVNSLHESGLPPERLDLELTESMLVENPDQTIRTLESLRELGAHTSMDDFGTGYSSLSYLTRFPLDSLKIDRAFVTNLPSDKDSVAIATAIVSMAKNLQLQIVAEGIETKSQMRFLNFLGCRIGQGYLFSRPVPGLDFQRLIRLGSAAFNV